MASIANLTSNPSDGAKYSAIAHDYVDKWQTLAIAQTSANFSNTPHTTLNYGANDSYNLIYNLYADTLLNLTLVPLSIYKMQSDFYPKVALDYGVPLDTRHSWTKSDWEIFSAAIAAPDTKQMFFSKLAKFVRETPTSRAFSDFYDVRTADFGVVPFVARPVVGGHFAPLALTNGSPLG